MTVSGWLRSARKQKKVTFLELTDGSTPRNLQVVWGAEDNAAVLGTSADAQLLQLTTGAAVRITGKVVPSPKPEQPIELQAQSLVIEGGCPGDVYPLQKKAHTAEYLREILHLRSRTASMASVLRLRSLLSLAFHNFFAKEGFSLVHTPILTSNDCEGAGELFQVSSAAMMAAAPSSSSSSSPSVPVSTAVSTASASASASASAPTPVATASSSSSPSPGFFGKAVNLTVSGQLHLETAVCGGLSKGYCFGPTFRAENSNTARHLSEFWMLEPEWRVSSSSSPASWVNEAMDTAERCIKDALQTALNIAPPLHSELPGSRLPLIQAAADSSVPWKRLSYVDAIRALEQGVSSGQARFSQPVDASAGLATEHEKWLADSPLGGAGRPVFVYDYPAAVKSFYMRENSGEASTKTVACFDLLVPGVGELVGGSVREERWEVLAPKMAAMGLLSKQWQEAILKDGGSPEAVEKARLSLPVANLDDSSSLDWYLDLRRFGSVPHAGFGLGFERLVLFLTGLENIRDAIPFPRVPNSCRM